MGKASPALGTAALHPLPGPGAGCAEPWCTNPPLQRCQHTLFGRTQSALTHKCDFKVFSRPGEGPEAASCFAFTPSPKQPGQDGGTLLRGRKMPGRSPSASTPVPSRSARLWGSLRQRMFSTSRSLSHSLFLKFPGGLLAAHLWTDSPVSAACARWQLPPPPAQRRGEPPCTRAHVLRRALSSPDRSHPGMLDAEPHRCRMHPLEQGSGGGSGPGRSR